MDLRLFSSFSDFEELFYELHYPKPFRTASKDIIAYFKGDIEFRVLSRQASIIITVIKAKPGIHELMQSFKPSSIHGRSMVTYGYNINRLKTDYMFKCTILHALWDLMSVIEQIEIRSNNIILKKLPPKKLQHFCVKMIKDNNLRTFLPKGVSERLGIV